MAEELKDKLALRIEQRRKQAEEAAKLKTEQQATPSPLAAPAAPTTEAAASTSTAPVPPAAVESPVQFPTETTPRPAAQFPSETKELSPETAAVKKAIDDGVNPVVVARMLGAIIAGGTRRKDLFGQIGKSEAWLSKRLGLLDAPKDIQRLIEAGELSESEYYDNRANVKAGVVGRGQSLHYKRMPTITINYEAALALASILQNIATTTGTAPIRLDAKPTKKDLTSILNQRAGEMSGMLKK
jgi:hypothetical protein